MKLKFVFITVLFLSALTSNAQINLGEKALGALGNGVNALMFSDSDAAKIASQAIKKMDSTNVVAGAKDAYTIRLNRVFGKHSNENGLKLNYKVYLTKEINAFAMADGSVRVFSGLMDIMDDNQLLAVIGHEIGHVANHDSRDAMKAAYRNAALVDAVDSQVNKGLSDNQMVQMGNALLQSKHSRKQESEADLYSYEFMKRNKYDVNAVKSAFAILAKLSEGQGSDFISKMMSSHPDPKQRAETAKAQAQADGLYKPYVVAVAKKPTPKKSTKKKK
jgi:putative metalloprotease